MIKNFVITPPVIGRISIGRVVEKNGKRLPAKDDQFTITTQVQSHDGWVLHPQDDIQRKRILGGKLRAIEVSLPFDDPDLCLRAEYVQFDRETGRVVATSDGVTCMRHGVAGSEAMQCASTQDCCMRFADTKPYGRLYVKVGDVDDLDTFIFRTTSYNSIRTLAARLRYYSAVSGGHLATMPLQLKIRGKSTTQSYRAPIYYVDLVVREGLTLAQAVSQAQALAIEWKASGFDQAALDAAARVGFANGAFVEEEEDMPSVAEEFFPERTPGLSDRDVIHDEDTGAHLTSRLIEQRLAARQRKAQERETVVAA